MGESTVVSNRNVGYSFSLSIEKEVRIETGAKYPDKEVVHVRLSGNADSFDEAVKQLGMAQTEINGMLGKKL